MFLIPLLFIILAGLWIYARWNFGTLEKLGYPVVHYTNPLLGSTKEIYCNPGGPQDILWMRKYGQVYGVYEGRTPQLYICNPELAHEIMVKDWQSFNARRSFEFGDPITNQFPDFLPGEKGKMVHSLYVNAFSSQRLREWTESIHESTIEFVQELKEKVRESGGTLKKFAIDQAVHDMSTELICKCMFNLDLKNDPETRKEINEVIATAIKLEYPPKTWKEALVLYYTHSFPFLRKFFPHEMFPPKPAYQFLKVAKRLMAERRKSGQRHNDIIDCWIEWWDRLDSDEFKQLNITELTLAFQAMVFVVAGQDQIATAVGGAIHHMAKDIDFRIAIRKEVDTIFSKGQGKLDPNHQTDLHVTEAAIQEALRLYTIFHRAERVALKNWRSTSDKFDITIPKGMCLQFPIWALNRNEEYTPYPDQFQYERFLPENKEKVSVFGVNANHSHGYGPRSCVGRPFVNKVMPVVLAYLVRHFEFMDRPDSNVTPVPGGFFIQPHDVILVDVKERMVK